MKLPDPPSWIPMESWEGFKEMRARTLHKPLNTERAQTLLIGKLEKLKAEGYDPGELLDEATVQGWQSVYKPHNGNHPDNGKFHFVQHNGVVVKVRTAG